MSPTIISLIILTVFLGLLALGLEIFAAMGLAGVVGFTLFLHQSPSFFANVGWNTMNSFTYSAVPLFVFMGAIFANTGVVGYLYGAADKIIGHMPGGLGTSTIGACALFGAMTGSSVAAAATFAAIAFPEMEQKGYDPTLSLGLIAVGGGLSVLIPPSLVLIIYGGWQQVSVVDLFAGALIPGFMLAFFYVVTIFIMTKTHAHMFPPPTHHTWKERGIGVLEALPWLGIVALVLGVIFGGIMTPTEAASFGAFLAIVAAIGYRRMSWIALKKSAFAAVRISAMIALVVTSARILGQVFQQVGLTDAFADFILGLGWSKYAILVVLFVLYMVLGCFMDGLSMLLVTLPFVIPILESFNISLIWFGVVFVVVDETALVTPPFGLNLFAIKSVIPKASLIQIAKGTLYFFPAIFILLALCTAFPDIVLWLPNVMFK
ncbi:MAG: TRAP transporter large permease [Chloroflexota bacterium]|nr:TRAP transporter large permease [Chloroflexota bacterium]